MTSFSRNGVTFNVGLNANGSYGLDKDEIGKLISFLQGLDSVKLVMALDHIVIIDMTVQG